MLLGDLEGSARAERAELIEWLFEQGVTAEEIRGTVRAVCCWPRAGLIGDDGTYVSTREISETYGIDLDLLQRVQRAHRAGQGRRSRCGRAHAGRRGGCRARRDSFLDVGLDPDHLVQVARVLAEGLSHAAEVMRYTALAAVMQPGVTELEIAKRIRRRWSARSRRCWARGSRTCCSCSCGIMMETEAVNASERAAGAPLPGARQITVAFADLVGFTRLGEEVPAEELGQLANRLADLARDVAVPPVRFIKTIGDAVMFVCTDPAPLLDAVLKLVEVTDGDNDFPRLRAGIASGAGGEPGRRLVRQPGEPGQPGDGGGAAGRRAGRRIDAR